MNTLFTLGPSPLCDQFWGERAQRRAAELGFDVRLNTAGPQSVEDWSAVLEGVEALITTWGAPKLTAEILAHNTTLKIVGHAAGSVAGIVSPALFERGIPVVTANDIMAKTVAEWCLMMTQLAWGRFHEYAGLGTARDMPWESRERVRGMHSATIAVWGYGAISSRLIELLKPLGPREILVHSNHLTPEQAKAIGVTLVTFDDLFARGDVIHLLGALTERNAGMVGTDQLAMIKDDAVLINAGRARLVEEEALLAELRKNRFTGIFDVHYKEPLPADSPFRGMPNVILTPHCAGHGQEGLYMPHVLEEFDRFRRGEPLVSEVSPVRAAMMTDQSVKG